jgi:NAD(P)-dependent dehydrogenase (short-subunit alcohol dehydrogenase family)
MFVGDLLAPEIWKDERNSFRNPVHFYQNEDAAKRHKAGWTPMGRLGTPADVGNAVALLCSEEANWITGQLIEVDGGTSLMDAHLPLEIQQAVPKAAKAA